MLNFSEFNEIINEGFFIKDSIVYFDPNTSDYINTSFGKGKLKPYKAKIDNIDMFSVYNRNKKSGSNEEYSEILKAIKGKSTELTIDYDSYRKFITRTSIYMADFILKQKIDLIMVMDSSSPLVSDLVFEINKRLPKYYDTVTYHKQIFKTPNLDNITINTMGVTLSDKNLKSIQSSIDKMKRDGYFKIQSIFTPNRKFIQNWLEINNNVLSKIIDKNVVIVDDILTTGSTISEAGRMLYEAGASDVKGLTIIKGS